MSLLQTRPPLPETEPAADIAAQILGLTIDAARNPLLNTPELGEQLHRLRKQLTLSERAEINRAAHLAYLRHCYTKPVALPEDAPENLVRLYRSSRPDRRGWFRAVLSDGREVETANVVREASHAA